MAVVKGYREICKKTYYRELFKNPFWMFLMALCGLFFIVADSLPTYLMALALLVFSIGIIIAAYFEEEFHLHNRVYRRLSKLDDSYIILPYLRISDGLQQSCTSYILISPKGIFNIKLLDFSGVLEGSEGTTVWDLADASNPYNIQHKKVKNPISKLMDSQGIIEGLLKKNHIDYLFLRSLFVIKGPQATFKCSTSVPIVPLEDLNDYIMSYADRPNMVYLKDDVTTSILNGLHRESSSIESF